MVVIVSASPVESKKICEALEDLDTTGYRVEFDFLRPTQVPDQLDPGYSLIVYNNNTNMNSHTYQKISNWRKKGCLASVLVLSKVSDDNFIKTIEPTRNVVLLEKPYLQKDLRGIAQKILLADKIKQRIFRRYDVAQSVSLSSYKSGFNSRTNVRNMSLGGLCLGGSLEGLQTGDLLRVDFSLDKINSQRTVNGKVIWVTKEADEVQAGLEFVKDSEVYSHLLQDIS